LIVRPKPHLIGVLTSLKGSIAKRVARRSRVTQLPLQLEPVDFVLS
jgi:putative membrane protein